MLCFMAQNMVYFVNILCLLLLMMCIAVLGLIVLQCQLGQLVCYVLQAFSITFFFFLQ